MPQILSYANLANSIMYVISYIRPNILHAVIVVSRYMHNPCKRHCQIVK